MALTKVQGGMVGNSGIATLDGVQFPATQVPSADPNCLDDYEEGSWTPSGWTGGGTVTSYVGNYVKIGRLVTVSFSIVGTGLSCTAASTTLSGLPFPPGITYAIGSFMSGSTNDGGPVQAYPDSKLYFAKTITGEVQFLGTVTYPF